MNRLMNALLDRPFRVVFIASCILVWLILFGCYSPRAILLEAQCGIGRDYVCSPQLGAEHVYMICGCMSRKDLKGN